jgi:hypothetical protein
MLTPVLGLLKYARHVPALGTLIRCQPCITCNGCDAHHLIHQGSTALHCLACFSINRTRYAPLVLGLLRVGSSTERQRAIPTLVAKGRDD